MLDFRWINAEWNFGNLRGKCAERDTAWVVFGYQRDKAAESVAQLRRQSAENR